MAWDQARDPVRTRPVGLEGEIRLLARRQSGSRIRRCRAGEDGLTGSLVGDDCARVVERPLVAASDGHGPTLRNVDFDIAAGVTVEIEAAVGPVVSRDEGEADGLGAGI